MDYEFHNLDAIVSCEWLAAHLDDPEIRIFDCTTDLKLTPQSNAPYHVISGRPGYEREHIPGAACLDLQKDFSQHDSPFGMTLLLVQETALAFARQGIGDSTRVILYSRTAITWATRFWWMLRWIGFDSAAVLNGGFPRWQLEGLPVSSEPNSYPAENLSIRPRPELFVDREQMLAAIGDKESCTINALGPDLFSGKIERYGRPGRIPGSINVPAPSLVGPEMTELLSLKIIAEQFAAAGVTPDQRVLTYCGGGIFATLDAFLLYQLGYDNVAVYDNSMSEWATDLSLPIETD